MMYVYVLEFESGALYTGITSKLSSRLEQHRKGECSTTAKLKPHSLALLHYWKVPSYSLASRFERYLHKQPKLVLLDIIQDCPSWGVVLEAEALTMQLQAHEEEIDKTGVVKLYKNALVSLPNKSQLSKEPA